MRKNLQDGTTEEIFRSAGAPTLLNDLAIAHGLVYVAVSRDSSAGADVFAIDPQSRRYRVARSCR